MLGKKHSEETRKKMSQSHKGYVKSLTHRENLSKSLTGYIRSEEQKEKNRLANQGSKQKTAKYNEEIIANIRIDYMNGLSPSAISIKYNINRGTIYGILYNARWKHVVPLGWLEFCDNKQNNK